MKTELTQHRFFIWLQAFRACLALIALYVALTSTFWPMVARIAGIIIFMLAAESIYSFIVQASLVAERRRAIAQKRREQALQEVLRKQKFREAQQESSEKYFDI